MICPGLNMDKCVKDNICKDKFRTNAEQIVSLSWTNPKLYSPIWTLAFCKFAENCFFNKLFHY